MSAKNVAPRRPTTRSRASFLVNRFEREALYVNLPEIAYGLPPDEWAKAFKAYKQAREALISSLLLALT